MPPCHHLTIYIIWRPCQGNRDWSRCDQGNYKTKDDTKTWRWDHNTSNPVKETFSPLLPWWLLGPSVLDHGGGPLRGTGESRVSKTGSCSLLGIPKGCPQQLSWPWVLQALLTCLKDHCSHQFPLCVNNRVFTFFLSQFPNLISFSVLTLHAGMSSNFLSSISKWISSSESSLDAGTSSSVIQPSKPLGGNQFFFFHVSGRQCAHFMPCILRYCLLQEAFS